jgi:hypothetical protein
MCFSSFSDDEIAVRHQHLSMKKHFFHGSSLAGNDDVCQKTSPTIFLSLVEAIE